MLGKYRKVGGRQECNEGGKWRMPTYRIERVHNYRYRTKQVVSVLWRKVYESLKHLYWYILTQETVERGKESIQNP